MPAATPRSQSRMHVPTSQSLGSLLVYTASAATVAIGTDVVEVGDKRQPVLLEEDVAIAIEEVGLIFVDEIFDPVEVMLLPLRGGLAVVE